MNKFFFGSTNVFPKLLFKLSPKSIHPYIELSRINCPTGAWLVYLPSAWSISLATPIGCLPDLSMLSLFAAGALFMRGAGCTINDLLDHDIDKKVFRTQNRPIPSKTVSEYNALMFLGFQLSGAFLILLQLNAQSILIGSSCLMLVFTYPLFKRFTYWPQIMLGITLNWGTLLGYSALNGFSFPICLPLYLAGICQTVIYDSVYAHQDIKYDLQLGLKSTAILFGDNSKKYLSIFAVIMASSLAVVGVTSNSGLLYFIGSSLSAFKIGHLLYNINLSDPGSCFKYFKANRNIGFLLFASIVLDRCLHYPIF